MSKQKRYFNELKALIDAEITLGNLNANTMRMVIDKALDWSRSQTIIKRPPKTDARLVYYIACESWLERLLESDLHAKFTSPHAVEDFAWRVLSQSGWGVPVVGYDTVWVKLITTFKPRLREWWAQSHEQDNRTVERIAVLMTLEQFDLKDEWVAEKVNELRTELINGMEATV